MRGPRIAGRRHWDLTIRAAWLLAATLLGAPASPVSYADIPGCVEGSLPSADPRYPAAPFIVTYAGRT